MLHKKIRDANVHPQFVSDVMKPMSMEAIMDNGVQNLSGGELQRVAIVLALGTPADIYLIDEPRCITHRRGGREGGGERRGGGDN